MTVGKVSGHGKPVVRERPKHRAKPAGRVTHLCRRLRAVSKHRANQVTAHKGRKLLRKLREVSWRIANAG